MLGHILYEIRLELYVLARNMSWPDGLELIWLWHGVGSNLGGLKFNFLFAKKWCGWIWIGEEDLSRRRGSQKGLKNH